MPRYAHQKPVNRLYSYNLKYMNNYYKPMTHYLEKSEKAPSELPGHQSLAELKRIDPVWSRHPWDWDCVWVPPHESRVCPHFGVGSCNALILRYLHLRPQLYYSFDDYYI